MGTYFAPKLNDILPGTRIVIKCCGGGASELPITMLTSAEANLACVLGLASTANRFVSHHFQPPGQQRAFVEISMAKDFADTKTAVRRLAVHSQSSVCPACIPSHKPPSFAAHQDANARKPWTYARLLPLDQISTLARMSPECSHRLEAKFPYSDALCIGAHTLQAQDVCWARGTQRSLMHSFL